jgi:hypothetical protein
VLNILLGAVSVNDFNELADQFVAVWNETDPGRRHKLVRDLWADDGMECTKARETRGHAALESRIRASHEKNVRDGGCRFRSRRAADENHGVVKIDWEMIRLEDASLRATGSYVLLLNEAGKIRCAYFFSDP